MTEPTDGLGLYQSIKIVKAGEITDVVPCGCCVRDADGTIVLRIFEEGMTARYQPVAGDWWVVYDDGYQSISPKAAFGSGYVAMPKTPA